ncbi:hypothetical protein NECAME_02990 [Necator americanus]|uniref:Uncharacterized protein n=1 Tax=Necator americanus TaxID=51031 RepID=W2T9Z7_NECAM|nr:hypothetical protein NECAME_02990 [Necator americanus]ETN78031.1 hypothetical protein NECAME_02990 [Necator americanus]
MAAIDPAAPPSPAATHYALASVVVENTKMIKLLVLIALAVTVYSAWDGQIRDIPGISAESMAKLRKMLDAAADAHREKMKQMRRERGKPTA